MKPIIPFLIFTVTFLFLANHHIITTTLTGLQKPKAAFERVENPQLTEFIKQKTSVAVNDFFIVNSDSLFGGMTGIPTRPVMTISKRMYETFSQGELNYVVLHETGHYVYRHTVKELVIQLVIVIAAFFVFRHLGIGNKNLVVGSSLVGGVIIGIIMVQLMRQFEWQADTFALQRLDDPQSMVEATKKLQTAWGGPSDTSLTRKLFYRGIPYSERIIHAESYQK